MDSTDSTSSMGIGLDDLKSRSPRSVAQCLNWSLTDLE